MAFTVDVFRMVSLEPWIQDINWHSNHLHASWNPRSFTIITATENKVKTLFGERGMNDNAAPNFLKFVKSVVKPHEDPLALILFIISEAGTYVSLW